MRIWGEGRPGDRVFLTVGAVSRSTCEGLQRCEGLHAVSTVVKELLFYMGETNHD